VRWFVDSAKRERLKRPKATLFIAAFAAGLVIAGATKADNVSNKPDPKLCADYADPIKVRIGATEFHIPDKYKPDLNNGTHGDDNQPKKSCTCRNVENFETGRFDIQHGYCKRDEAFELESIHIDKWNFRTKEKHGSPIKEHWRPIDSNFSRLMAMDVIIEGSRYLDAAPFFCKKKQAVDYVVEHIWHPYVDAKDFYESGPRKHKAEGFPLTGQIYYYTDKYTIFGLPVVVQCDKNESTIPFGRQPDGFAGSRYIGRRCEFQASIGDRNSLYIRFHDKEFLPSEWGEGFKQLEAFIQSIIVNPLDEVAFTSCDSIN